MSTVVVALNSSVYQKTINRFVLIKNFRIFVFMLSKEERKAKNTAFWEEFRKVMRNYKSSNGRGINWINYPTDVKDVYLRMHCDAKGAQLSFDIQPKDDGIRSILWEQMTELRKVMEAEMKFEAVWNEFDHEFAGRKVSRILWKNDALNFFDEDQKAAIHTFFKERLLAFDRFYQEYKEILILLAE